MTVKVYVEGGGDSKDLRSRCRKGFSKLFEKVGLRGRMPRVVACGSRNDTFGSFRVALTDLGKDDFVPILLVDAEAAVTGGPWDHLWGGRPGLHLRQPGVRGAHHAPAPAAAPGPGGITALAVARVVTETLGVMARR